MSHRRMVSSSPLERALSLPSVEHEIDQTGLRWPSKRCSNCSVSRFHKRSTPSPLADNTLNSDGTRHKARTKSAMRAPGLVPKHRASSGDFDLHTRIVSSVSPAMTCVACVENATALTLVLQPMYLASCSPVLSLQRSTFPCSPPVRICGST